MIPCLTNMFPFFSYLKNFAFLTQIMKEYAIVEISTETKIVCGTESICGFGLTKLIVLLIFQILRHHDIITILYWTYELRFAISVSNVVCMLNFIS